MTIGSNKVIQGYSYTPTPTNSNKLNMKGKQQIMKYSKMKERGGAVERGNKNQAMPMRSIVLSTGPVLLLDQ